MGATCRPLNPQEIDQTRESFAGQFKFRDQALFVTLLRTGFRITEILSLKVKDVYQFGKILDEVSVRRGKMKKRVSRRPVPLHEEAKVALRAWLEVLGTTEPERFVFESQRKGHPISRVQAWRILKSAFAAAKVGGATGTHSCRKTFAKRAHEYLGHDLHDTMKALGHKNVQSTISYLASMDDRIKDAFLKS